MIKSRATLNQAKGLIPTKVTQHVVEISPIFITMTKKRSVKDSIIMDVVEMQIIFKLKKIVKLDAKVTVCSVKKSPGIF